MKFSGLLRLFLTAFCLTLCVMGLPLAFAAVGHQTKQVMGRPSAPATGYTAEQGLPVIIDGGGQPLLFIPAAVKQGLFALLPPPARATLALLKKEAAAVEKMMGGIKN